MLEASAGPWRADHVPHPGAYHDADELVADLRLLQSSLRAHRGERLADGRLGTLARQAEIFGFHLASLDLRQTSDRHTSALAEVLGALRPRGELRGARRGGARPRADRRDPARAAVRATPAGLQPRDQRDARALPARAPRPRARRPARDRGLRRQHDARAERPARGAVDGEGRRRLGRGSASCRCSRRWPTCTARRRSLERLFTNPAYARHLAARGGAQTGDGRVQRLQQGWRLPDARTGSCTWRSARSRRSARATASGSRCSTAAAGRSAAAADRRTARSSRSRRSRSAGGCGSPSRASRSRTDTPIRRSRGGTSSRWSMRCSMAGGKRPMRTPSRGGAWERRYNELARSPSARTAGSSTSAPSSCATSTRRPARRDRPPQHRQPASAALGGPGPLRPARDPVGVRVDAEPRCAARLVRARQRAGSMGR